MSKSKKWSEQCLVEITLTKQDETGNEVVEKSNRLEVCTHGLQLYRKEFMQNTATRSLRFFAPFDFLVFPDMSCPKGQFYELEYFIGENGVIYHALLQVVDPVKDIPFVIGVLRMHNLLPKGFNPIKARLRDDIDEVWMCSCEHDEKHKACIVGGVELKGSDEINFPECLSKYGQIGMLMNYYRGDVRELCVDYDYECREPQVMVCGSGNVNDPAFKAQRESDLQEMRDLLDDAMSIAEEYGLKAIYAYEEKGQENETFQVHGDRGLIAALTDGMGLQAKKQKQVKEVAACIDKAAHLSKKKLTDAEVFRQRRIGQYAESVLSAFLQGEGDADAYGKLRLLLRNKKFTDERHQTIARAIIALHQSGEDMDVLTLTDWLVTHDKLEQAGGIKYLAQLTREAVSTFASLDRHMDIMMSL